MEISYFVAFGADILSFFSPCLLPLVPAYLAVATTLDANTKISYQPVLFHSFSFVLGFSFIFVAFGISAGFLGSTLPIPLIYYPKRKVSKQFPIL